MKLVEKPRKPIKFADYCDIEHEVKMRLVDAHLNRIRQMADDVSSCETERQFYLRSAQLAKQIVALAHVCNGMFERKAMTENVPMQAVTFTKASEAEGL